MSKIKNLIIISAIALSMVGVFYAGNLSKAKIADAQNQVSSQKVISVSGEGVISVKPDIAYINLGVHVQNKDAKIAQSENTQKMNRVIAALKKQGIKDEDIQTIEYSIYPEYNYNYDKSNQPKIVGYSVRNMVRVAIRNVDKVGVIIDAVASSDANLIDSISFGISDAEKYYKEALKKSVENAKGKATSIGDSLGVKLSTPSKIIENSSPSHIVYERSYKAMDAVEHSTPVSQGQVEIRAVVTVEYNY
ncbi:SIMPL domain-containing protein [Alkalithermobacter paradoxus]|uniref:26 kDa periplasmic immunogenic protein n=1 Tax=Alkalithermobacter paradoxus TaxID=29349 RepID=A0A1V4I8P2_9FIRM|nr:26 kDa periplasmic immunogenic protein precursor [[Clostridium] thermoalcaliphilum]